jgi:uncharacterized protein (DUF2141 family)
MAFKAILSVLAIALLGSCAQVGILSGGAEDTKAPRPIEALTSPPNQTTQFNQNGFSMTFDEFIQLNNPQQTVIVSPADIKPELSIEGKSVKVQWKDTLKSNTTYVVYLNGTVKDISEGNDTLITYVFSTGNHIDSLRFKIPVVDAFTSKPLKDITVGLFLDSLSSKPVYFARTSMLGWADFQYLKPGKYLVRAFEDKNKDLTMQETEPLGFRNEAVLIDSSYKDSTALRLFTPLTEKGIKSFRFQAPGSFTVTGNSSLRSSTIIVNGQALDSSNILFHQDDSLQFFFHPTGTTKFSLRIEKKGMTDSATVRILEKNKTTALQLRSSFNTGYLAPTDSIQFQVNDLVAVLDTSLLLVRKLPSGDTLRATYTVSKNTLGISVNRVGVKQLLISAKKGALKGTTGSMSDSLSSIIELKSEKDFGGISFSLDNVNTPAIVQLIKDGKVLRELSVLDKGKQRLNMLQPGEYQFRVIEDANENKCWDTGDLLKGIQPEIVRQFSSPVVVRSNWEVDVKLTP